MDFVYKGTTTTELQAYLDYCASNENDYEERHRLMDLVQRDVLDAYFKALKESHFVPEKERADSRKETMSPSGKYKLVVSNYETSPGCWSYSQGKVFKADSDTPIAVVNRNYAAFPFLFVEGHPNGHDYLVCGEDYQGQTVVELDTGKRREHLSDGTDKGWGFCWADYTFEPSAKVIVVDGCVWACPYEYKFFDFADPMNGWPEIESGECIYADNMAPTFEADGTIKTYQTDASEDDDDEDGELPKRPPGVASFARFKREGLKLIVVEEWVSDAEKERRIKREEFEKRYEEEIANFKATDPLYLAYKELLKDPVLSADDHVGIGITHTNWCPTFTAEERRWCHRIISNKKPKVTVDLEWATKTGPIKLVIYKDGKKVEDKFFDHSVENMARAFTYAKAQLP
jgi:hypothetical protein